MSVSSALQLRGKGTLTLPAELRKKYDLNEGDIITLIDLGEGSLLLTPILPRIDRLGDRIAKTLNEDGVSLDEILTALNEEREQYYHERYAKD
jgi:AbrB family looped-hinge helix DNA binding protein